MGQTLSLNSIHKSYMHVSTPMYERNTRSTLKPFSSILLVTELLTFHTFDFMSDTLCCVKTRAVTVADKCYKKFETDIDVYR
jgi:hypothetical protein